MLHAPAENAGGVAITLAQMKGLLHERQENG